MKEIPARVPSRADWTIRAITRGGDYRIRREAVSPMTRSLAVAGPRAQYHRRDHAGGDDKHYAGGYPSYDPLRSR